MARTPQFKVALEPNLRDALEAAAARSGRTLAAEIRARLEGAVGESADPVTRDLQTKIAALAEEVELETGAPWHAHLGSFAAFRQGVVELLARRKAAIPDHSPTAFGDRPHQTMIGSPEEIGTRLELRVSEEPSPENRRARRRWMENAWRELVAFQQRQKRGDTNNGK
jgi:hypothetical protein